ncbi:hypothetical protein FRB96_000256 [Tulasnella sp. 330]|nr:hypothetical protein FRB96_000256 [Tulasnella sp. 330]KAG8889786.1 hypothetical protein FRB98_002708 [Tulasnella sp. 332]
MAERTRILIVGAGAIGCFYGSRLHNPGQNVFVSLVCRSNFKAISSVKGVQMMTHSFGDYFFEPEFVYPSIDAAASDKDIKWNYVVVATKALPDVSDDSGQLESLRKGLETEDGGWCLVLVQNGVGVEEPYRRRFGEGLKILTAVTVANAEQIQNGVVKQNRWTRISLGPYTDGLGDDLSAIQAGKQLTSNFVRLLKQGGIKDAEEHTEREMQTLRWHKIAINAAMNPSAVLSSGAPNADMASDPELRVHLRECMLEVFRAAEAVLGLKRGAFPPKGMATPEAILKSTERNTGGRPSMLGDWERGSRMELEVILGNPIRAAKAKGADMPRLQAMYALLKMAQKRRDDASSTKTQLTSGGRDSSAKL